MTYRELRIARISAWKWQSWVYSATLLAIHHLHTSKENSIMKRFCLAAFLLGVIAQLGLSQDIPDQSPGWYNRYGRWTLGLQGGVNDWLNDYNTRNNTGGADLFVRYGLTRHLSVGIMGGWDKLQSINQTIVAADPALRHSYIGDAGISADAVAWYHFTAGKTVAPFVYAGLGSFWYERKVEGDKPWTEDKTYQSIHIPVGVGVEVALTKQLAISADLGLRVLGKSTDNYVNGVKNWLGTDYYQTGRVGVSFSFGSSPDDDNDGDLLTNGYEARIGTDPNKADSDGDGLTDFEEVTKYNTKPLKADSDDDGLPDGDEVMKYHTDPLKTDTDGDGLTDGAEVSQYQTNPLKADTDGEGLSDGDEVLKYLTNPIKTDTDGDGLSDFDEVTKYHTDPLKLDTDGGSVSDGQEIKNGTNPLDPTDDVPKPKVQTIEVGKAMVLEGIVFKSGKATIEPESEPTLMEAFGTLKENAGIAVEIRGYTDNLGKVAANKKLSLRRAEAVRSWLVSKGIDAARIAVHGYGPDNPISNNSTPEGRAKNRRIEFFRVR
jgi:outer membrane protein OmpA-like peptidoglycan-associated protein